MDRNDPKTSYADWQAQRQKYLDSRSELEVFNDLRYQQLNKSDAFYFGLEGAISERQAIAEAERPIGDRQERLSDILHFGVDVGLIFVGGTAGKIARSTWRFYRTGEL
jgi:hypothetical protein